MTSTLPAEARPTPPIRRPPDSSRPAPVRSLSHVFSPIDGRPLGPQRQMSDMGEDRPAKRRKVEGDAQVHLASIPNTASPLPKAADTQFDNSTARLQWIKPSAVRSSLTKGRGKVEEEDSSEDDMPTLPPRPWRVAQMTKVADEPKPSHRLRVNIPVPNTPDSIDFPATAPHFVPRKPAGFFPWTGKHPEDVLSDTNVKTGYFDKPPNPTEKELNTARVPLYNAFKHKSGVESLSILFSLVLDQKNQHGLISSVSTFKPPPRVTLTEAKRKSWIADLANSDVPLRRLSRTIPQGIRGQALLDQCLQSAVPISRAIWFAKCVCANEIRTLKRKGTTPAVAVGTETKWLREWTINVEQFLETHVAQASQPDWKSNIQYALRLMTRLYLENLLDRDHYLDWILRSFAAADVAHTAFWLMVIHLYKHDMSHYRRRGSKLAETLVEKYRSLEKLQQPAVAPLRQKLRAAIRELLFGRPVLFLMPDRWTENSKVIQACLDKNLALERQLLGQLSGMNERAMGHSKVDVSSVRAPDQAVVERLDAAQAPYDLAFLEECLRETCPDFPLLIETCLEWSCSRFRHSKSRIYLATRLIKRWQRVGYDVDTAILTFLTKYREGNTTADIATLRHLIAQCARCDCFPLSRYMQWLMVRGLPKKGTVDIDQNAIFESATGLQSNEAPASIHFLLDLSLHKAENHVISLRRSILERTGFDMRTEDTIFTQCINFVEQRLANMTSVSTSPASNIAEPSFAALPWTLRTRLSMWLRTRALESARAAQNAPALPGSKVLNEDHFILFRHILESMDDEAVLADVVGILSTSQNEDLVASLVATIHFHADTFAAIGALEVLQKQLCQVYMAWRPTKPTMPLFTSTLLDLCNNFPAKSPAIKLLQQDLVRGDRGRAIAACSPYSDGIAESLQQAGATFVEDFEAILQSETNMNEQTMNGLFSVLADRIEKQQKIEDDEQTTVAFCQLLSRLRLCRRSQGEVLIHKWISRLLLRLDSKWGPMLLKNLLSTSCISFQGLLEAASNSKTGTRRNVTLASLLYQLLAPAPGTLPDWATYQTRTKWYEFSQREPRTALEILCEAGLQGVSTTFDSLLLSLLVKNRTSSATSLPLAAGQWFVKTLSRSLNCPEGNLAEPDLRCLLQNTNIFSLSHVQLRLRILSEISGQAGPHTNHSELADVLYACLKQAMQPSFSSPVKGQDQRFSQLLQTVGSEVANLIRHKVENEFLDALPKLPISKVTSPLAAVFPSDIHQLSFIVERAFQVCREDTSPSAGFMSQMIDRLSQQFKFLSSGPVAPSTPITSGSASAAGVAGPSTSANSSQISTAASASSSGASDAANGPCSVTSLTYLKHMLQMVCLQRPALIASGRTGPNTKQGQSEQVQLLVRLASIATHPAVVTISSRAGNKEQQTLAQEIVQSIFDIIATIVDDVSDEVNSMCARLLKDRLQDGRLRYVFGTINMLGSAQVQDMGQGLQLAKEGKGILGDWKPRMWEVLDNGSGKENETSLGLGLFGARYG